MASQVIVLGAGFVWKRINRTTWIVSFHSKDIANTPKKTCRLPRSCQQTTRMCVRVSQRWLPSTSHGVTRRYTQWQKKHYKWDRVATTRRSRFFQQRYASYLRKVIRPKETMMHWLDTWFARFKVTASEGQPVAGGRLDPRTLLPLLKSETKEAVTNCKKNVT